MAGEYVQGLDDLIRRLDDLKDAVARRMIARSVRKGAEPIRDEAKRRAPVDDDSDYPGTMRDSITINVTEQTSTHSLAKIGPTNKGFYGKFQEFGTAHHGQQPFLGPAYDDKRDEAIAIIGSDLGEQIDAYVRKQS